MTQETVFSRIQKTLVQQLNVNADEVTPQAELMRDLGADSLDHVECVMALEEEFGIEIDDDEAEKIRTVQDAINSVEKRLSGS